MHPEPLVCPAATGLPPAVSIGGRRLAPGSGLLPLLRLECAVAREKFKPSVKPLLKWQPGLFEALLEALADFPEPIRSFALRRAVEEAEFRVQAAGGSRVDCRALLATTKLAISQSTFNALVRVLEKKKLARREDVSDA